LRRNLLVFSQNVCFFKQIVITKCKWKVNKYTYT